jgi:hypothetical protein
LNFRFLSLFWAPSKVSRNFGPPFHPIVWSPKKSFLLSVD